MRKNSYKQVDPINDSDKQVNVISDYERMFDTVSDPKSDPSRDPKVATYTTNKKFTQKLLIRRFVPKITSVDSGTIN